MSIFVFVLILVLSFLSVQSHLPVRTVGNRHCPKFAGIAAPKYGNSETAKQWRKISQLPVPNGALDVDNSGEDVVGPPEKACPTGAVFRGLNRKCGGNCTRCKSPFACRQRSHNGRQAGSWRCLASLSRLHEPAPFRKLACGERCNKLEDCAKGMQCRGKVCISAERGVGRKCRAQCQHCKSDLICLEGICAKQPKVSSGASCGQLCNTVISYVATFYPPRCFENKSAIFEFILQCLTHQRSFQILLSYTGVLMGFNANGSTRPLIGKCAFLSPDLAQSALQIVAGVRLEWYARKEFAQSLSFQVRRRTRSSGRGHICW